MKRRLLRRSGIKRRSPFSDHAGARVREAKKLGFDTVILPMSCMKQAARVDGIHLTGVRNVREAIQAIL